MIFHELRTASAVRERCANIARAIIDGKSACFTVNTDALPAAARLVQQVTSTRYPDGHIPYHSRWRHFESGGIDRAARLAESLAAHRLPAVADVARAQIDLTVVSVLLDAGAGDQWQYHDPLSGQRFSRSEGLGVASFNGFLSGAFSQQPKQDPCRVDGTALMAMTVESLARVFQVTDENPLVGLAERAELMRRLGKVLTQNKIFYGEAARPGQMFDRLSNGQTRSEISASELLTDLLNGLSDVWMTGRVLNGVSLGDCWPHPEAGGQGNSAGWVPFHKLSQWLTYSLLEPFEAAGMSVTGLNELTGLPEYRNGGLFIDTNVIVPREAGLLRKPLLVSDTAVIEWRALTVYLLDQLTMHYRELVNLSPKELPLACVLEGGTWAAGRQLAAQRRNGLPPLNIVTDGTVF